MINKRPLGQTGLEVSEIGFGAGIVAGLFVRGDRESQISAVTRAVELGVNHFDTAPQYGDGDSELNLGKVLGDTPGDFIVGTKIEYLDEHFADFRSRTFQSVDDSLKRLGRNSVEILYLHNNVRYGGQGPHDGYATVSPDDVLRPGGIADALDEVRARGLASHIGFTGTGDAAAVIELIDSGRFEVMQTFYSLLNPSGSIRLPAGSPLHDFKLAISRASRRGMGVVAIRVMGGGVLAGDAAARGFRQYNQFGLCPRPQSGGGVESGESVGLFGVRIRSGRRREAGRNSIRVGKRRNLQFAAGIFDCEPHRGRR